LEHPLAIEIRTIKVSATGSAGSASGTTIEAVPLSKLLAIYMDFTSAPSTTDITVSTPSSGNVPAVTILTLTNVNSDGWYYPQTQIHDNTGSAITGAYMPYTLHGSLSVALAQADAVTDELIAYAVIEVPGP